MYGGTTPALGITAGTAVLAYTGMTGLVPLIAASGALLLGGLLLFRHRWLAAQAVAGRSGSDTGSGTTLLERESDDERSSR